MSENCVGCCGERFWPRPRQRGPSIPEVGCKGQANEGIGQKIRRPKTCTEMAPWSRIAGLLLGQRSTRDMGFPSPANVFPLIGFCAGAQSGLPRRVSPCGHFCANSAPRNFQTRSKAVVVSIPGKPQQELPVVATRRQMIDIARNKISIGSRHGCVTSCQ